MMTTPAATTTQRQDARLEPVRKLQGHYRPPADKSIAHRALILSALAEGRSSVAPKTRAADVASTAACLRQLGVAVSETDDGWVIESPGLRGWTAPERGLDCGNSGTTMRLLAGCLAGCAFESSLLGDESLSRRPMRRIADPLTRMGAGIQLAKGDTPPIKIASAALNAITYRLPVASAQVKSAVLLAGMSAVGETVVIEDIVSRDHTEQMLRAAGVECLIEKPVRPSGDRRESIISGAIADTEEETFQRRIRLAGRQIVKPHDWVVPGDFSAAAYLIAAAVGIRKSDLIVADVGLNSTRTGLLRVLKRMGAEIEVKRHDSSDGEPRGQIRVRYAENLKAVKVGRAEVPAMIDELPLLAVIAGRAEGVSVIRGAEELRHKESDRIAAVSEALR
ncbi:MAG TPA: 3-phosphoshikimate 1-carboxyvinyltransferase, partial [candidate division Zixibacteria bacterium]|nr:3-phosphoshikimate 1-carboxyvinyltransferase [candidate division Zixibacteria bacterium]